MNDDIDITIHGNYIIMVGVIRQTLRDALNGHGIETLATLFYPEQQAAIAMLLNVDTDIALHRTINLCQTLLSLDEKAREDVRHALTWMSVQQLEQALAGDQ